MFKNWSITDLAVISLLLVVEESRTRESNSERKRKKWVHKKTEGEFFTLYKELVDDEEKFHQYFRMSKYQFNDLFSRIEPLITKNTTFRESITPIKKISSRLNKHSLFCTKRINFSSSIVNKFLTETGGTRVLNAFQLRHFSM
jgi:hypothetical protein